MLFVSFCYTGLLIHITYMVEVKISDQSKVLGEVTPEWLRSTISKNRVMNKRNCLEVNIDSENASLQLYANCEGKEDSKPSNDIESRILFLWNDIVLDDHDLNPDSIYDFLNRMEEWISFVPTASSSVS